MGGTEFGVFLKKLRQQQKVSSKVLSQSVGKAVTYVSQIERGLIKNPDYETCFKIMLEVGYERDKIEDLLSYFGIRSPEAVAAELAHMVELMEAEEKWRKEAPEDYVDWQVGNYLYALTNELKDLNDLIYNRFDTLIHSGVDKADSLLRSIEYLTSTTSHLDFFCSLVGNSFGTLTDSQRSEFLAMTKDFIEDKSGRRQEDGTK